MIPRIHKRGQRTIGLLYYLYGPGKYEEHTDPHLVASWDSNAPDPGRDPQATLKQLQRLLDQPLDNIDEADRPAKHVYHLSVRNGPDDRILTDDEWGEVARRMVAAARIDDPGADAGCRWAAVRHADDHIHIIATLVREDGYKPDLDFDAPRVQASCPPPGNRARPAPPQPRRRHRRQAPHQRRAAQIRTRRPRKNRA